MSQQLVLSVVIVVGSVVFVMVVCQWSACGSRVLKESHRVARAAAAAAAALSFAAAAVHRALL